MLALDAGRGADYRDGMRRILAPLLALSSLPLGGCAAGLAASAVGAAVNAAGPAPITEDLRRPAVTACTARAEQEGEVRIIDVELRQSGRVIVWGAVQRDGGRRSFECRYDGEVSHFRLREIRSR